MAKKTNLEKIEEIESKINKLQNCKKALVASEKEKDRKMRNHYLCQAGGEIEKILGRALTEGDNYRLASFLEMQERNGGYFSKAMNRKMVSENKEEN